MDRGTRDHPQEDLAKLDYKSKRESNKVLEP